MFNFEPYIQAWRRQMSTNGRVPAETLDELESHLRDNIECQIRSGKEPKEAFEAAIARLGNREVLEKEFAKIKEHSIHRSKKFLKVCYFTSSALALAICAWSLGVFELSAGTRIAGLCFLGALAFYFAKLPILLRSLSHAAFTRFLIMIKLGGIVLVVWPVWALLAALHVIPWQPGDFVSALLWSLLALIALTMLGVMVDRDAGSSGDSFPPWFPWFPRPVSPIDPTTPACSEELPHSEAFTPEARKSLISAGEEATSLGHDFIGTEHVLLGLLKFAEGPFAMVLSSCGVDGESVRREIERLVATYPKCGAGRVLPLTPRARKAIQLASRENKRANQKLVNPEHLFLGLLLEGSGVAALALKNLGVRAERIRQAIGNARAAT
jgi:hypothetical protein